jgi:FkbM family methyltransferase
VFTNHFARLQKLAKLAKAVGYAKLNGVGGKSRPIYLDVGARGGLPSVWDVAARLGIVRAVFVEPDRSEAKRLSSRYPQSTIVPFALGARNEVRDLYLTRERGRSSLLLPDDKVVSTLGPEPWTVEEVTKVEVVPLNTIWDRYSSAPPHFVKIDVQGFEKEILLGMENLLGSVLCIELEASFLPFYVGQPSFQELFEFLHERGFDLVKIRPLGLYRGAILEFNAFLVRRDRHGDKPVALWKRINDVGDHKRTITLGY